MKDAGQFSRFEDRPEGTGGEPRTSPETSQGFPRARAGRGRGLLFQVAALLLVVGCVLAGTGLARWLRSPGDAPEKKDSPPSRASVLDKAFVEWEKSGKKPDLVLVISGQQNGYLLPCGCSTPQVGGLERRYNYIQALKKIKGWPVVPIDLGDVPQRTGIAGLPNIQGLIKYRYAMTAMRLMDYLSTSIGEGEASLSLDSALAEYALQHGQPRVVVNNLMEADRHFPDQTKSWELSNRGEIRMGVTAVVGPTVAERVMGPDTVDLIKKAAKGNAKARAELDKVRVRFSNTPVALNAVLAEMTKARVELPVLLYQGPLTRNPRLAATEATACAQAFPQFRIIVCLSQEDEPSLRPFPVINPKTKARSLIVMVGKKGKYIGVLGIFRTGKADNPFEFKYRAEEMTETWLTPKEEYKGHPIVELMEDYTRELKRDNYLHKYGQIKHLLQASPPVAGLKFPGKVAYIGSDKCKRCHESAWNVWKKSDHAKAYDTLAKKAEHPSNRQYDPECIVCHTVGFGYEGGFRDAVTTPLLKDVGCESCHGPGSVHARNPNNAEWRRRMNPWKPVPGANAAEEGRRKLRMDVACQKCHDIDNDVHWARSGFARKWPLIAHPTAPDERRDADPEPKKE